MDDNYNNPSYMYTKHMEILTLILNFKKNINILLKFLTKKINLIVQIFLALFDLHIQHANALLTKLQLKYTVCE